MFVFQEKKCCGCFWLVAFRGRGGATATPRGLKSFKVLVFLKKGGAGLCSRVGYLRFLNIISPSGVVATYSNPASISFVASTGSLVALHIHSSEVRRKSVASMLT